MLLCSWCPQGLHIANFVGGLLRAQWSYDGQLCRMVKCGGCYVEGLPTGFTESGILYSIQEKLPTVMAESCQSLGAPQGADEVLTYLAAPGMGKETPCLSTEGLCSKVRINCNALGSDAATERCCPMC